MMRVFIAILCSLLAVCSVSARDSRHEGTDGQAAIYRLLPFERAVRCTKYFEGYRPYSFFNPSLNRLNPSTIRIMAHPGPSA